MKRCDSISTSHALRDQPLALLAFPFQRKEVDGLRIPLLPPSSGRRWRVAPEVGFALFFLRPTPCPSIPFQGKGIDGLLILLLPPSFGRRWRAAPEVGFALFFLRPTPCPSGIPLPWEGGGWATHPASPSFLWKEVARSAGGWLRSLFPSANLLPFFYPLPREGDRRSVTTLIVRKHRGV